MDGAGPLSADREAEIRLMDRENMDSDGSERRILLAALDRARETVGADALQRAAEILESEDPPDGPWATKLWMRCGARAAKRLRYRAEIERKAAAT